MRQILTLRFPALLALLCIPLISFAQTNLAADGNTHTINKVGSNNRTGGYQDFLIPSSLGAYDHIEFFLKGGDGGRRKVKNECRVEGGKGGNNGVNGLPGVGQSVNGGENGEPGGGSSSCGGGGLVSRTTCGADGGHLTGGNGQSGAQNGGFGYGAGSAGDHVGGGGIRVEETVPQPKAVGVVAVLLLVRRLIATKSKAEPQAVLIADILLTLSKTATLFLPMPSARTSL